MSLHYDREGNPISLWEWVDLYEHSDRIVAQTKTADGMVSTVWMGLDHRFLSHGPPLIFETMVFPTEETYRWSTEEEALKGHYEVAQRLLDVTHAPE